MAREVRHTATHPEIFDTDDLGDDGKLYICRCGLSNAGALCDGSHNATVDEDPDSVFKYKSDEADGDRRRISECEFDA